ncbi:MAG TPA: aldehyde dehydrogenase family protein [Solirubrobacteraceae bacterium]|nr:aldehyde dehydrogenase family protein [Solirubrobacteraceae bacterium]
MAMTENPTAIAGEDAAAVAELHEIVERQRAAFLADPFPSLEQRQQLLGQLAMMLIGNRDRIAEAMSSDFGVHPSLASDLIEVLGPAGRAAFAAEQLAEWMAPEPRFSDPGLFGSGRAYVQPQPKGVIGNIVPWNFPFDLSVGPLVEMLAAGNRVVIKPSEYTPACAALLQQMIRATFDPDRVDVVVGGLDLAREFTRIRWDHLLYTGSPQVGREIAKAAAEQLVPVTLELGGKCPAILTADSIDAESVKQVLGTKALKNGQMCISVDYCLVPRDQLEQFAELAADHARESMPGYAGSESCTGIISARHLERIEKLLGEARDAGADVRPLEEAGDPDADARQLPLSLVLDPADELALMQEEIFGPVLPVVPYDSVDEAVDRINRGERPLALYVFTKDSTVSDDLLRRTTSGGACVNCAAVHGALPSLPFGGIGQSGSGRHHGVEGFREFSNLRSVFVRGEGDMIEAFAPPYGPAAEAIVQAAFPAS